MMALYPYHDAALHVLRQVVVLAVVVVLLILVSAATTTTRNPAAVARDDDHLHHRPACSLNGVLSTATGRYNDSSATTATGECVCDKPWYGPDCALLKFRSVTLPQGYGMAPHAKTTWGGGVLHDPTTDLYHLYVSAMTNGCGLSHWGTNSRIEHAVADKPEGPYEFADVAINTRAHNPAPIVLPDGSNAIFHIFDGDGPPDGGMNCNSTTAARDLQSVYSRLSGHDETGGATMMWRGSGIDVARRVATDHKRTSRIHCQRKSNNKKEGIERTGTAGSTIHVSKSLDGPWRPVQNNTLGKCNNPAPFIHPANHSLFIICNGHELKRSDDGSVHGPWVHVADIDTTTHGAPPGNYEDPYLWIDHRLHYHVLYHRYITNEHPPHGHECIDGTVSAHGYSEDGLKWYFNEGQPYNSLLPVDNKDGWNLSIVVSTRERPQLFFDAEGRMTHLLNGACGAPSCPKGPQTGCVDCKYSFWDFTLAMPLDV